MFIQDALFGTTITKYTPPLKIQYARKIMYIYQFAFFKQAQTEITKAATNFKKSAGKFAYAQPLYNNHGCRALLGSIKEFHHYSNHNY